MVLNDQVNEIFHHHIDAAMRSLESLPQAVAECSTVIVDCLMREGKILCCGEGRSAALSQLFCTNLISRFHHERPSFPAIALDSNAVLNNAIASDFNGREIYARQVLAYGKAGDILITLNSDDAFATVLPAIQAAHSRNITVISLNNTIQQQTDALLSQKDYKISLPEMTPSRSMEMQLFILNTFTEIIDQQIFGLGENS